MLHKFHKYHYSLLYWANITSGLLHLKHSWTYLTDILVVVTKTEQQVRQDVDYIGLKQPPQHHTQHLKGKQCTLPVPWVLLVLNGILYKHKSSLNDTLVKMLY